MNKFILLVALGLILIGINYFSNKSLTNNNSNWETYNNNDYSFRIDFPSRFKVTEYAKREPFYDSLAIFIEQPGANEVYTLRAIHDIDIYKNSKPEMVAKQEGMDSGIKYNITTTKIGDYFAAITIFDIIYPVLRSTTITIAHPSKNLFIVISIDAHPTVAEYDRILSSFKFTK